MHDSNIVLATLANQKFKLFSVDLDSFCQTHNAIKASTIAIASMYTYMLPLCQPGFSTTVCGRISYPTPLAALRFALVNTPSFPTSFPKHSQSFQSSRFIPAHSLCPQPYLSESSSTSSSWTTSSSLRPSSPSLPHQICSSLYPSL